MRDVLLERVRPLVDGFTEQLVDLLVADVQRRVGQLGEAFDVALSTFAAELAAHDVRDAGSGSLPGLAVPEVAVVAKQASTSSARASLETRNRKALQSRPEPRVQAPASGPGKRKPSTCHKCGERGFTSQGCGKTHNVSTAPASAPSESSELRMGMSPASSPSIVSPPPPIALPSSPSAQRSAKLPSANATSAPAPSFDVATDRREEHLALSSLATWRKSYG